VGVGQPKTKRILGARHVYRLDGTCPRHDRLPIRLRHIETPLDGFEKVIRHLGALDLGEVKVFLEMQWILGGQSRRDRLTSGAAQTRHEGEKS
jgi:hypothetical protein